MTRRNDRKVGAWTRTLLTLALGATALAQPPAWRLATLEGLWKYPAYYHLQPVLVRGELTFAGDRVTLRTDTSEIRVVPPDRNAGGTGRVDVRGYLFDVGRLEPGDPRLGAYQRPDDAPWPRPGAELVISANSLEPAPSQPPVSIRSIALEPGRFDGQTVTVIGQFRGRNLFGDLPDSPRRSQYDFVLKSGDAAIWIVGLRPRARRLNLDVNARMDTSQWVEISGVVGHASGLVTIDGATVAAARQPENLPDTVVVPTVPPSPPAEVVFSTPTQGEIDVSTTASVRVQFARNIKESTLTGRVRITYESESAVGDHAPIEWEAHYDPGLRAVELRFTKPLEPFKVVRVELAEGIEAFDGAAVVPWSLIFTVGG